MVKINSYKYVHEIKDPSSERSSTYYDTDKSLSEALIFASTDPQYDDILLIELQVKNV